MSRLLYLALLAFVLVGAVAKDTDSAPKLVLREGDHICIIGNTLATRMSSPGHNHFEAMLYQRFPKLNLVVRNLAWPADEVALRPRALGFGTPDEHLTLCKADVVMAFFGFNESFKGPAGVEQFKADLDAWIVHTLQQNYSGKGAPRIVLVSPIAAEDIGNPSLPDAKKLNANLELYSRVMKEVAEKRGVVFADVFHPLLQSFAASGGKSDAPHWTTNNVHLNAAGDEALAHQLGFALGLVVDGFRGELSAAIADKNFHWYHRHRIVDSYYVYGGRADLKFADGDQTNRDVMQREREVLDVKIANRDRRIWDIAQGKAVPEKIDDSNVPPFLPVKTSFGSGKGVSAGPNTGMTSKTAEPDAIRFLGSAESKKHFKLAPGYAIDLFASEETFPELGNAVSMAFDARGRLWVSTFQSYPQWKPGGEMNDKILILEDTNGDGKADTCRTFAEGLHLPISFQFYNGGILVSHQRELLFLKDTDGDDKADTREQVLDGFDSADSHHVINSFTYGPGGDLYFQEGTFQHSQVETPWGPVRCVDAGTYRYEPRTQKLEVFISYKYANPHGMAFDRWGQPFIADASGGANYFGTAFSGWLPYPEKHSTMQQWFPKRVRPTSGCEFVSSGHFPDSAQGDFLLNNCIGVQGILQHKVKDAGSGFEGTEVEPLLLSDDPLFRPVAMTFAPDGSLYVIDWAEALIGHMQYSIRDPLRDKAHGRIWRITYPGRPLVKAPVIAGEPVEALLELLKEPEDRTRERVKQELSTRDSKEVVAALEQWWKRHSAAAGTPPTAPEALAEYWRVQEHPLIEALWVCQWHDAVNQELLRKMLRAHAPEARAAATRVLCAWRDRIPNAIELLLLQARDEHPRVRLEAVRAASWFAAPSIGTTDYTDHTDKTAAAESRSVPSVSSAVQPSDVALEVLNHPMDYYLDYTLGETMRVLDVDVKSLKNPAAIAYVTNRLTDGELAAAPDVEPILQARLEREGFDPVKREAAITRLLDLRKQDRVTVITDAMNRLDTRGATAESAVLELGRLLLAMGAPGLKAHRPLLYTMTRNATSQAFTRRVAYAATAIADGTPDDIWKVTDDDMARRTVMLTCIPLIPYGELRAAFQPKLASLLDDRATPPGIRTAALEVLPALGPLHASASFTVLAAHLKQPEFFDAAVNAISQLPKDAWDRQAAAPLAQMILDRCTKIPADQRTDDAFIGAQQLGIDLATLTPDGGALKESFRRLGVATVLIKTLREQMIYDKLTFEVEAGKPVAIILDNTDIMPHNLVIVQPGSLEEIAMKSQTMPPVPDKQGRLYIPDSGKILAATKMLEPGQREKLTWTAPTEPGNVPFVCTFPGHSVRMKGEIVVRAVK
jgi:glucose/arabinose dehydrogenase/uncharacterized cupredoxin-like copper-binding protein